MIVNHAQLQVRAREFALTNELAASNRERPRFWPAFRSDMASLRQFAKRLTKSRPQCTQPAEDWLLDHIAFLETQAQEVLRNLPRKTLHQLPRLQDTGQPRIYALCEDYLNHVDGSYNVESFELYLEAYQEVSVLKVAEAWAVPTAMRVVIIRRLAQVMREVRERHEVCYFVTNLLNEIDTKKMDDTKIRALLERRTREQSLRTTEVVHLVQHLTELEPDIRVVRDWLAAHVENGESSLEQLVSFEHELQAELQVTSGHLVRSLHRVERHPWRDTFTKIAKVEQILLSEVSGEYSRMDFASRDLVRNRICDIAKQLRVPETLAANTVVGLAAKRQSGLDPCAVPPRDGCPAYYVLDPHGITSLRKELGRVARPRRLPQMAIRRRPLSSYVFTLVLVYIAFLFVARTIVWSTAPLSLWSWLAVTAVLAIPVSEWTVFMVHAAIGLCCKPTTLVRYDFSRGLPEDAKTMVVIPIIWATREDVDDVLGRLEVHYLANRQDNIHFAILADFADSNQETQPNDGQLVARAVRGIEALQNKYGKERFFLFHRSRKFNFADGIYMGWERKRGKLVEFVELLSGSTATSFSTVYGETSVLANIRYVFTVDHDTQLPIGVVSRMAGTIHFPYNRPRLNDSGTRVVEGYGVLQPRIGVSYESTQRSRFAALWAGEPGIDPYSFAVSNPYQDLFGRAIFVGKGIFDVEVFRKTLVERVPDNHVLSHDLLEGGYLRAGLTSDIEVVEEYPPTFLSHQQRAHRWIRGDWQLLKWLRRTCVNRTGERKPTDLCGLTRWQIIDNIRRSTIAPALWGTLWLGLTVLPGSPLGWLAVVMITVFLPFLKTLVQGRWHRHLIHQRGIVLLQNLVQLMTLPFVAVNAMDALARALYRMLISHKKLLEWVPAKQNNAKPDRHQIFTYGKAAYLGIFLFCATMWTTGELVAQMAGTAITFLWIASRFFIHFLNHAPRDRQEWDERANSELRSLASEIWLFYERYVTQEESWLPPDNVQYHPSEIVAHRTSPTNIGLYLASTAAAFDLGLIELDSMLQRIQNTIETLKTMEKWEGHLFNWYDTRNAKPLTPKYISTVDSGNFVAYLMVVRQALLKVQVSAPGKLSELRHLCSAIDDLIEETNFWALYNPDDRLFCLGYDVGANRRDTILYDLLASEARQASFVGIALGQIPVSHWFTLARTMTTSSGHKTLVSWSGTMFEYLMPSLNMRTYRNTVWDSTYQGVIKRQQAYASTHGVPFGISESGYYAFDHQLNYQYRAFGVPGLGFDRGLERNLVVAPYAAILALPFAEKAAMSALNKFRELGAKGPYGFYEAVDFTGHRLPKGSKHEVIRSFMAHHQGMSLLSLTNVLEDNVMIKRFHADPRVKSADLLLQEKIPVKAAILEKPVGHDATLPEFTGAARDAQRIYGEPSRGVHVQILSNGTLQSTLTHDGNGFLAWNGLTVTRWREDSLVDTSGVVVYVHDRGSEETYSVTRFPCREVIGGKTIFDLDKVTYQGSIAGLRSELEVTVPPDVDAEVRRLTLTNESEEARTLEITSFMELTLASQASDSAHPAFSKLFIQTSHNEGEQCLLAKRRPRDEKEHETWAVHSVYVDGFEAGEYEFETDRALFIGRGHSLGAPKGLWHRLKGTVGSVADPAFSMRRTIHLKPQETAHVYIITGIAQEKEQALQILSQMKSPAQVERAFHLAWVRTQIDLRHLHLSSEEAAMAHQLAGRLLYTMRLTRLRREAISRNVLGQSSLWSRGISGDVPVLTVVVRNLADLPFVNALVVQHQYLVQLGLQVDLVVLDDTNGSYQDELMHRLRENLAARGIEQWKRVIGVKASQLSSEERTLFMSVSRIWLNAWGPSLRAQLQLDEEVEVQETPSSDTLVPLDVPISHHAVPNLRVNQLRAKEQITPVLGTNASSQGEFFNGWGGFVDEGRAYQIYVQADAYLPRPWTNVLSNPSFGCLITELGTGYTWWRNSREFKLTPWSNDPVLDPSGEALYLSDLDSQQVWSAAPKPAGSNHSYRVIHGFGNTSFEQTSGDVVHTMQTVVPLDDPLKLVKLSLRNTSQKTKTIVVTYYAEWVLGVNREGQTPFIVTEWDGEDAALLARNHYQETFRDGLAFLHMVGAGSIEKTELSFTADRKEFIGLGGSTEMPQGLTREQLSGRTGIFADSCGAIQARVELRPGAEKSVIILLGCTTSRDGVHQLIEKYNQPAAYEEALQRVTDYWHDVTHAVQVTTPSRAMDVMLNGWLLYQALACRLWARTAFYQAGGAFGFRDQLQDSLAFLHTDPALTRKQILFSAAHQYEEGDVQHWWHEETKKGIRTRFSDDLLWLPYAVSRYIQQTGDTHILAETVPFLHSDALKEDELERYEDTVVSEETGSLWDHCLRAIRHALHFGEHGIPLMGIGDWNDGMNRVGAQGKGESVWLGWFLLYILKQFSLIAKEGFGTSEGGVKANAASSQDVAEQLERHAVTLQGNLNQYAWDGAWFRRAYTDWGIWLGSIEDKECRIDAIAQSWAVISDGSTEDRQVRAMRSFDRELVDRELGLARLLTQAFDELSPPAGYIQGYPPGIRENGGQYTHGVIWSIVAWAMLGRRDKAFELFHLLNPISHTQTPHEVLTYGNEPYVMTADVYTASPHQGFGGWSWYTGAAGWMYQAGLEYVLGLRRRHDRLYIQPCVPPEWETFQVRYRYGETIYVIEVDCSRKSESALSSWVVDGNKLPNLPYLQLEDDKKVHSVTVSAPREDLTTFG